MGETLTRSELPKVEELLNIGMDIGTSQDVIVWRDSKQVIREVTNGNGTVLAEDIKYDSSGNITSFTRTNIIIPLGDGKIKVISAKVKFVDSVDSLKWLGELKPQKVVEISLEDDFKDKPVSMDIYYVQAGEGDEFFEIMHIDKTMDNKTQSDTGLGKNPLNVMKDEGNIGAPEAGYDFSLNSFANIMQSAQDKKLLNFLKRHLLKQRKSLKLKCAEQQHADKTNATNHLVQAAQFDEEQKANGNDPEQQAMLQQQKLVHGAQDQHQKMLYDALDQKQKMQHNAENHMLDLAKKGTQVAQSMDAHRANLQQAQEMHKQRMKEAEDKRRIAAAVAAARPHLKGGDQ